MTAAATVTPPATPPRGLTRQDIFSVLGALGAVISLVTAVMFYFGWRRSDEQSRAMHIDVSLFGFSSQDYVLRSISSLYLPLLVLIGAGLAWLWLHAFVVAWLRSEVEVGRRRLVALWTSRLAIAGLVVAAGCVLFALAAGMSNRPALIDRLADRLQSRQWVVPLVLVAATLTSSYLWWIYRQLQPVSASYPVALWQSLLPVALIAGTVTLGSFWILEEYASAVGRGQAQQLAGSVHRLARTVVLSPKPLGISAPGVNEERIGSAQSPDVRYRTTGLRLLARSGGKVLLVHDGWTLARGTVIVLPDSDDLSWQFSR